MDRTDAKTYHEELPTKFVEELKKMPRKKRDELLEQLMDPTK